MEPSPGRRPPRSPEHVRSRELRMLTMDDAQRQSGLRVAAGQIVKGRNIAVRARDVRVELGYKSEGVVTASEFEDISAVNVGDEVPTYLEKLEDKDGKVVVSKEEA